MFPPQLNYGVSWDPAFLVLSNRAGKSISAVMALLLPPENFLYLWEQFSFHPVPIISPCNLGRPNYSTSCTSFGGARDPSQQMKLNFFVA